MLETSVCKYIWLNKLMTLPRSGLVQKITLRYVASALVRVLHNV